MWAGTRRGSCCSGWASTTVGSAGSQMPSLAPGARDLVPRHLVLTTSLVAAELSIPQKSASAALRDLVAAGILVEHGISTSNGRGRPARNYTSPELLGLAGASPLRR